jgi:hypothetical protein
LEVKHDAFGAIVGPFWSKTHDHPTYQTGHEKTATTHMHTHLFNEIDFSAAQPTDSSRKDPIYP